MKLSYRLLSGLLALSVGTNSQAATIVHITGSTAFRKATITAIEKLMLTGAGGNTYHNGATISAGKFKAAYNASTSSNGEQGDTYVVLEGNIPGCNNPVIVKTAWAGSVGGLTTVANNLDVTWTATKGFLSSANLDSVSEASAVGDSAITGGKTDFTDEGDGQKAQITMSDSFQESAGISGLTGLGNANANYGAASGLVGIVPFEWVANNGVTAPVKFTGCTGTAGGSNISYTSATLLSSGSSATNTQISAVNILGGSNIARNVAISSIDTTNKVITISGTLSAAAGGTYVGAINGSNPITGLTQNQAVALLQNGGATLSQFTGNSSDTTAVYAMGRNFDSGTRLSEMSETAVGVFTPVNAQMQPSFVGGTGYASQVFPNRGKGGGADQYLKNLDKWASESMFPSPYTKTFALGGSGFNGGGDLGDALASAGSVGATPTSSASKPILDGVSGHGGWLVGYLGRSDAERACKATTGANTAHRITWNGTADWTTTDTVKADGTMTSGYKDSAITEGVYNNWEYEFIYAASGATGDQTTVGSAIADQLFNTDAAVNGLLYSSMNVSKTIEGGVMIHN